MHETHVDRCPHNGIYCGLDSNDRDHCAMTTNQNRILIFFISVTKIINRVDKNWAQFQK